MYPKSYLAPLTRTEISSIIPWEFLPTMKTDWYPFYKITVAIILYTAGIGGCGAKSSPVEFTSSTIQKSVPSESSSIMGFCLWSDSLHLK